MGFLSGKRALIVGIASQRSIATGIAEAMAREGAELAFTYQNEKLKSRVEDAAEGIRREDRAALRRRRGCADRRGVRRTGQALGRLRHPGALGRLRAARSARRRVPRGPDARELPHRPRHLQLQPRRAGQGRAADDEGPQRQHPDAELPRRRARAGELQRHGPGQGQPRGERALPGAEPRPGRHARQRDLRRPDQDPGRRRHRQLPQDAHATSRSTRRCAAASRSRTSATSPRSCARTWPPASPARSPTSTPATTCSA